MISVSADSWTKAQLSLDETITEDKAKQVIEHLRDNRNYQVALSNDKLVIQRYLRD